MSLKSRGTSAERDLIHLFWGAGWAAMRAAGSGSTSFPCPDLLVANSIRRLAIEVKRTTEERKYFPKDEIRQLRFFAEKFGAEGWVAIKFFRRPWVFLSLEDLEETPASYVATLVIADRKGLSFEDMTSL